jgi:serine O-acetyltransferase
MIDSSPSSDIWRRLRQEAEDRKKREPLLAQVLDDAVLNCAQFADALAFVLADELASLPLDALTLRALFVESYAADPAILTAAQADLIAIRERDPAAASLLIVPFLFFKGFHALQAWRTAHWLWDSGRDTLALFLQSRIARRFTVDIHPAARIGRGIMMDHAHGIVIGETAVIEDDVSLLHNVTLGGTGKESGDRHPKIRSGVMIGAGAKILGNIEVGAGARIAAGSIVLENVPPHVTVVGAPARIVGQAGCARPAQEMDQMLSDAISKNNTL